MMGIGDCCGYGCCCRWWNLCGRGVLRLRLITNKLPLRRTKDLERPNRGHGSMYLACRVRIGCCNTAWRYGWVSSFSMVTTTTTTVVPGANNRTVRKRRNLCRLCRSEEMNRGDDGTNGYFSSFVVVLRPIRCNSGMMQQTMNNDTMNK